ncbi:MAG: hypothetical protein MUF07_13035 [Steroidobacteraceae bacterium]|jgi:hypothetical protein|nr:hypothetical protein [Steroidobacteraceae bacterium]
MSESLLASRLSPSLVTGGPFHALMRQLRMLDADDLPSGRAAWLLGAIAWLVGAALATLQSTLTGDARLLAYFLDASPAAHALVAMPVMIGIERFADRQLLSLLAHPIEHGLVPDGGEPAWRDAVALADRRSGSAFAEATLLAIAISACLALAYTGQVGTDPWSRPGGAADASLTWAGAWTHVAVGALFLFLVLRWLLRFFVWTLLLARLAWMPLRLVASHPDRAAGLGFMAAYPTLFLGLVLGVGTALGAKLLNAALYGSAAAEDLATVLAMWVAVVLVVFVGPVLLFAPRLAAFRNEALLEFGALGMRANRGVLEATQAALATGEPQAAVLDGASADMLRKLSALNALNALHDRVNAIQPLLVTRATLMQLVVFALLPMLPALATQMPLSRLIDLLLGGFA